MTHKLTSSTEAYTPPIGYCTSSNRFQVLIEINRVQPNELLVSMCWHLLIFALKFQQVFLNVFGELNLVLACLPICLLQLRQLREERSRIQLWFVVYWKGIDDMASIATDESSDQHRCKSFPVHADAEALGALFPFIFPGIRHPFPSFYCT